MFAYEVTNLSFFFYLMQCSGVYEILNKYTCSLLPVPTYKSSNIVDALSIAILHL